MAYLALILLLFFPALGTANNIRVPFKIGERLEYRAYWLFIPAGQANLNVQGTAFIDGQECFHFSGQAFTRILFFFKVDDRANSYATVRDLTSLAFDKRVKEGRYRKEASVKIDWKRQIANYGDKELPINAGCRDALAAFYYFRTLDNLEVGQVFNLCVFERKSYPLLVKVEKREEIEVAAGKFKTVLLKITPDPNFEGLFRNKGDIWAWLTDDNRKILVKLKASLPILGTIRIELDKFEEGK